jgi:hypothetical protein
VAPGLSRDYVAYVRRPVGTDERKGLRFISQVEPTDVRVLGSSVPHGR